MGKGGAKAPSFFCFFLPNFLVLIAGIVYTVGAGREYTKLFFTYTKTDPPYTAQCTPCRTATQAQNDLELLQLCDEKSCPFLKIPVARIRFCAINRHMEENKTPKNPKKQKPITHDWKAAAFRALQEEEEFDLVENEHFRFIYWTLQCQVLDEQHDEFYLYGMNR